MDVCCFKPPPLAKLRRPPQRNVAARVEGLGFDLDELRRLTGGDRRVLGTLLQELLRVNRDDLRRLRQYLARRDLVGLAAMAHRIKGAVRMIRAQEVMDACEGLEAVCEEVSQVNAEVACKLRELINAVICLEVRVRRFQANLRQKPAKPMG
ncbi:Hpt domain-containing protein [Pseudomonas faucium]|uniref:Hpt domain-containing protein n=1 Tax=Pseudomonas faucium TaxID=2740518 RepID=UPI001F2C6DA0|nr:Hpt domain-containing protein [Pseudomonas faucium]